ncbi:hypothetical protein AYK20_05340 [Thermoplasmatales archaeon SG8-52-1]|nr:MAG: hypothetical protein AYK20_05340 [Thermoplasmatales archaeon SG8-52-1]
MKIFNNPEVEKSLVDNFELVKDAVQKNDGSSRAGLMLGLQELGATLNGFIGAYYQVASNIIVVNTTPLRRIIETKKELLKPYGFHILLHEYIHSLGYLDEEITKQKTYEITKKYYGETHIATELSKNMKNFFPNLVYPIQGWLPPDGIPKIKLVKGFDWSNTYNYIT